MWAFPFDKRNCSLKFGNDDLRASWSYLSGASVAEHESPWKVLDTRKLGRRLELRLRRSLATWMSSLFVPSTALVFCSWIPLWLSSESQTARAVLGASVFFASLLVVLANERDLPRTSYLKAIDLWSALVCLFPLLALVQATMVSSAAYKRRWRQILKSTARAVLGASVFFASLLVVLANERDLPRTSYLKAIDLWSALVCLFPLLALVQATMVSSAAYKRRWRQILKSEEQEEKSRWLHEAPYYAQLPATRTRSCSRVLDYVCRIALPTAFCAAVSLYMIAYVIPYSR
uniref:Neur_chan_memb domain-containing protein n=1 Tax=Steinernema glaseri TaxID=37863 RepID=A0A1I7ZPC4_9BILA